jgi:hypothetical protein
MITVIDLIFMAFFFISPLSAPRTSSVGTNEYDKYKIVVDGGEESRYELQISVMVHSGKLALYANCHANSLPNASYHIWELHTQSSSPNRTLEISSSDAWQHGCKASAEVN